jgi:WD40-like Beta Propeller Repeat
VKFFSLVFWLSFVLVQAQSARDLLGTWQSDDGTYIMTLQEEGHYIYEAPSMGYLEEGTWQIKGANFAQQWQDPQTGEARSEVYTLEFLSPARLRLSGGNFVSPLIFIQINTQNDATSASVAPLPISLASKEYLLKLPPPELGEYVCATSTLTATLDFFNPSLPAGGSKINWGVGSIESLVGDLTLHADGTYTLTHNDGGTYQFDSANNQVIFTGFLEGLSLRYSVTDGWFSLRFGIPNQTGERESSFSCNHPSPNAIAPTTSTPNPGLLGILGLHTNHDDIISFTAETGNLQVIGQGMEPYQNVGGETIYVSNKGLIDGYVEFTILAPDGSVAAQLPIDDSQDVDRTNIEDIFATGFSDTPFPEAPILSDDGNLIAYASVDDLGNKQVVLRQRNGDSSQVMARIPNMTQPSWTKDGRLIMAGTQDRGGIYITDTSFTNLTRVNVTINNPETPALSPDGQTIIFKQANQLWRVNREGTNLGQIATTGLDIFGYPTWSPDGQWVAVAAAEPNFASWSWVLVLPVNDTISQAQQLELPTLEPINVKRESRITWR